MRPRVAIWARPPGDRFSQGQWNVLVYELSATVIHLAAHRAFAADISAWHRGKKLSRNGKNQRTALGLVFAVGAG